MKAVIPAAGLGTRFLPYTKAQPKEMLPILDRPTIQYVVEEAKNSGLTDILIITGKGKRAITDYFSRNIELEVDLERASKNVDLKLLNEMGEGVKITYIPQIKPLGLGDAVLCAKPVVGDEPFAVLLGDDICIDDVPCTKQLKQVYERNQSSVIAVQEVPKNKISAYGIITGARIEDDLYKVDDIIEKPSQGEVDSNLATIGRYVLVPEIFKRLESLKPGHGGEIQLTDAIRELLKNSDVFALKFSGKRFDVGNKVSWLKANVELALRHPEFKEEILGIMRDVVSE